MADLMSDRLKWDLIRATVQGDQSPASCSIVDGRIVISADPIAKGAKPNLKLLSQILRSTEALPREAREWLADLFDADARSEYQVKTLARRFKGAKPVGISNNWDAAEYAEQRIECGDRADDPQARDGRGDTWEVAVQHAAKKFRISKSAVEAALKSYRNARDLHDCAP